MPLIPPLGASLRFALFAACSFTAARLPAQCAHQWATDNGFPGVHPSAVYASTLWDPDGLGPLPVRVVVAGAFVLAGDVLTSGMATWDPVTRSWSPIAVGSSAAIFALAARPNGELIAGGAFSTIGGALASNIARWNGTSWAPLATGVNGTVAALAIAPNGDVVAGGSFTTAGGLAANRVARWNGAWSTLGAGVGGPPPGPFQAPYEVRALAALPNGDVMAGGHFSTAGSVPANRIARWDGADWTAVGGGMNDTVLALAVLPSGDVVAGGRFTTADGGGANRIAQWNGTSWAPLAGGMTANIFFGNIGVEALATLPSGDLLAAGRFETAGATSANCIARWNGASWSALGSGMNDAVQTLTVLANGNVVAGGYFSLAGGKSALHIAEWSGAAWSAAEDGLASRVRALGTASNGDLVAGGEGPLVRRTVSGWSVMGTVPAASAIDVNGSGGVNALAAAPGGVLYAGGTFLTAGGVSAKRVARWNGSVWSTVGGGVDGSLMPRVNALAVLPNGHLVLAGVFETAGGNAANNIARWSGALWSTFGSGVDGEILAIEVLANGDIVAGGEFATAGGVSVDSLVRWDGTAWSSIGGGVSAGGGLPGIVNAIDVAPNGDLVVTGVFASAGGVAANNVARWNGSNWSPLGGGVANRGNGVEIVGDDVVVGGAFTTAGGVVTNNLARWNGTMWTPFGTGLNDEVSALLVEADGDLVLGGAFSTANGIVSAFLARLGTTCPAQVSSAGPGCPSSGGSNTLAASTLPWVDATFVATGTGLPASALVVTLTSVTSFAPGAVPLSLAFPEAGVGCDVLVSPDILGLVTADAGTAQSSFFLPNTPPLVGVTFFHQMVPLELDAQNALLSVTATNALQLTAGLF